MRSEKNAFRKLTVALTVYARCVLPSVMLLEPLPSLSTNDLSLRKYVTADDHEVIQRLWTFPGADKQPAKPERAASRRAHLLDARWSFQSLLKIAQGKCDCTSNVSVTLTSSLQLPC